MLWKLFTVHVLGVGEDVTCCVVIVASLHPAPSDGVSAMYSSRSAHNCDEHQDWLWLLF